MPSKDVLSVFNETANTTTQRDLDELVFQIKEKLRVKAITPSHASCSEKNRLRASPYSIPSRGSKCGCCDSRRCLHRYPSNAGAVGGGIMGTGHFFSSNSRPHTDDPYEALQELIRDGDLIKEAVRRLNISCFRPKDKSHNVFYDSDEERTPFPFNVEV